MLSNNFVDELTIGATVDGQAVGTSYSGITNTVTIDDPGTFGSEIKISYCQLPPQDRF